MTALPSPDPTDLRAHLPGELPRLRALLRRLCRGGPVDVEVEDLVQEVCLRALRYGHAFDSGGSLAGWLGRIAFRVYLDRRGRRAPAPLGGGETDLADPLARSGWNDDVEVALAALRPVERDVLLRFHHRRESVAEIAAALGMPAGTVKSHLHRARRRVAAGGEASR